MKLIWLDFRNPKRVHSKWFENGVESFLCFLKSWKSLVWNRFQKNLSWLPALYLRFDYKVEFSKEFEKQSLVCFLKFPMFWKWLGLFQNLKNIYSKRVSKHGWNIFLSSKHKIYFESYFKRSWIFLPSFDLKSSFWKVKHFKTHKKWTIEFKVLIKAKQDLLEA